MRLGDREVSGSATAIGDIVCESANAVAQQDCEVTVMTPAYGAFNRMPGSRQIARLRVGFAGKMETVFVYEVLGRPDRDRVRNLVLDHPLFSAGGAGRVYCAETPRDDHALDARRFALFCTAVAEGLLQKTFGVFTTVHLHDWPAAFLLILRRCHRSYRVLRSQRCVFTLHDLGKQGLLPFAQGESPFTSWFPDLGYNQTELSDPTRTGHLNATACAIRLADAVHVLSSSYAEEIVQPGSPAHPGGEGLHQDLAAIGDEGRLFGILGGCEYHSAPLSVVETWEELLAVTRARVLRWAAAEPQLASSHFIAHHRLAKLGSERPRILLTSTGPLDDHSIALLRQRGSDGKPALYHLLEKLGAFGMFFIMGKGVARHEQFLTEASARYENLVFLNGVSEALEQALYALGDLFVKASAIEPGVGTHLYAQRAGQPCLVHLVGGLKDTIEHEKNGFGFAGYTPVEQADALVEVIDKALTVFDEHQVEWLKLQRTSSAARFEWSQTAERLLSEFYAVPVKE